MKESVRKLIGGMRTERVFLVVALAASLTAIGLWAWNRGPKVDPQYLQDKYGISGAQLEEVPTPSGNMEATIVPVTLENGQPAQLIIPRKRSDYPVYLKDQSGSLIPVTVDGGSTDREQFVRSQPVVYERTASPERVARSTRKKKRSFTKEALIVAGGAGAGSAIGAAAGGGKGAAVGALSGGIAGLVYDLATRSR